MQLTPRGELLVQRDAGFEGDAGEWGKGDGEGGDDVGDREGVEVGAVEGVGGDDGEGEEVLVFVSVMVCEVLRKESLFLVPRCSVQLLSASL